MLSVKALSVVVMALEEAWSLRRIFRDEGLGEALWGVERFLLTLLTSRVKVSDVVEEKNEMLTVLYFF